MTIALLGLCALLLLPVVQPARAESLGSSSGDATYFPETGFWVDPLFHAFWRDHGGLMTFGYPISRVFYQDGLHKQYFERAIFERHENFAGTPYEVLLTRLGALITIDRRLEQPFLPVAEDPEVLDAGGRFFPETGHHLQGTFLAYWDAHGGLPAFGYPLTEKLIERSREDNVPRVVQYFERARFEHHPQHAGTRFEVLLGHLGREALDARLVPPVALERQPESEQEYFPGVIGPLPVGEPTPVACGFNLAFWSDDYNDDRNAYYLERASAAGCSWVRVQFNWESLQPAPDTELWQTAGPFVRMIDRAHQLELRVLVNVSHPPAWARPDDPRAPADPEAFGAFMGRLTTLFGGKVDAWQIWNEPNILPETNGLIDPEGFLPLLKAGYVAVKDADPDALVVFPGLAPCSLMYPDAAMDNLWYLERILSLNNGEAAEYFDVLAVHAYGAGNDPDTYWPGNLAVNPGWTNAQEFYFRSVEHVRRIMVDAGLASTPIWLTEMGWPVGAYAETWGYGRWITEDMQARYTLRAFEIMREEWHWVEVSFIWHLNFAEYGGVGNVFTGFSVIRANRVPRVAYTEITRMNAALQEQAAE